MANQKVEELSFLEHFQELRARLLSSILVFMLFSVVGYLIRDKLTGFLLKPLNNSLVYSSPAGALNFILKISLMFGAFCSIPFFVYQILKFVMPALPEKYKNNLFVIIFFSSSLMMLGAGFAYFLALPSSLYFLSNFSSESLNPLISTEDYLNFVAIYLLGFGLIFQLPLLLLLVNYVKKFNVRQLIEKSKYVILISFVLAAILTPTPDIINQLIMAIPMIVLYYFSVILIFVTNWKSKKKKI